MTTTERTIAMIRPLPVFFLRCAPSSSTRTSSSSGSADRPASTSDCIGPSVLSTQAGNCGHGGERHEQPAAELAEPGAERRPIVARDHTGGRARAGKGGAEEDGRAPGLPPRGDEEDLG